MPLTLTNMDNKESNMSDINQSAAVLTIENLSVGFGRGDDVRTVTEGVSLAIKKGETLALVGESGSGKSVTANSVMNCYPRVRVTIYRAVSPSMVLIC